MKKKYLVALAIVPGSLLLSLFFVNAGLGVVGSVDSVVADNSSLVISGWACDRGSRTSIDVQVYAGNEMIGIYPTSLPADRWANLFCGDINPHRFRAVVPYSLFLKHLGKAISVRGVSTSKIPANNTMLSQSGQFRLPYCQSATLCLHGEMPLIKQGNTEGQLYSMISTVFKVPVTKIIDTFCSPASGAMVIKTAALQTGVTRAPSSYLKSNDNAPAVLKMIQAMGTSVTGNGTSISKVAPGLNSEVVRELPKGTVKRSVRPITGKIAYRASAPLQVISVSLATGGVHTVVVNGSEGDYFRIFDPAGRIYTVKSTVNGFAYVNSVLGANPTYFKTTIFNDTASLVNYR